MTTRLVDIVAGFPANQRGIAISGTVDLAPLLTDATAPLHRNRAAYSHEALVTSTDGTTPSLENLESIIRGCADNALVVVLLSAGAEHSSVPALSEAIVAAGVGLIEVTATPHPEFPLAVVLRRSFAAGGSTVEDLSAAIGNAYESPEGGSVAISAPAMDAEARARLDRVRAETARMRLQLQEATDRAVRAERQLARIETSTSMRVGRRVVEVAKNPSSSVTLPRDVWRMWRLRTQRRRGTTPTPAIKSEPKPANSLRDDMNAATGSQLLNPRFAMTDSLAQLSIIAVTSDSTAAALSAYAAVTRVRPHDAAQIMSMVDSDLVLIDTDASIAPSAWSHLGDPSATDRERALLDLIDTAHAQGRPVVLVRSGDPSRSASLSALAARCDLVLTSSHGVDAPAWNAGIDLASAWLPSGDRDGVVYIGQLDARWSAGTRESLLSALRATDNVAVHDWSASASMYAHAWPEDIRGAIREPVTLLSICDALDGRAVGIAPLPRVARGLLDPTTAAFLAGALRVVATNTPDLDPFAHAVSTYDHDGTSAAAVLAAIAAGPIDAGTHRQVLRELFLHHATPVMLQRLVERLGLPSRPLRSRDVALVTAVPRDLSASTLVGALLAQRVRPAELILLSDHAHGGFDDLRSAGIGVHHVGSDATAEQIGAGTDSPYIVAADVDEVLSWPDSHLLDAAIDFEVGFEGVDA